jgi:hypothetical protein
MALEKMLALPELKLGRAAIGNLCIQMFRGFVLISGRDGDDAQHYQEKQLRNALREIQS